MHPLTSVVKNYAWGSRSALAALAGRPVPSERPEAEMWLGAHPAGSAEIAATGRPLADHIAEEPARWLGEEALRSFGPKLPYLMKLIAVAEPLSLQVHPSAEQAADGHRRAVYGDPWPKPELIYALTPFTALAGFRPGEESARLLSAVGVPVAVRAARLLAAGSATDALRCLLEHPDPLREAVEAAMTLDGPDYRLVGELAERHPGDPACLAPLLLRRHDLAPGGALFLGAGVLHSYLSGLGVEIMAASDNVVRAGLTSKPVDVPELLRVVDPRAAPRPVEADSAGVLRVPSPFFRLRRLNVDGCVEVAAGSPRILFCVEGTVGPPRLGPLDAAFVPAAEPLCVAGKGTVFVAEPGGDPPET
ncbi:mannose-6-phosphate isomerase, class I [Spirillospora sp. NPDC047418]